MGSDKISSTEYPKVSVIIVYTNDAQIEECEKWIDSQDYGGEIEKIILDNRGNKAYSSAASALNDGANKASGEILIFMHQDVYLWDTSAVRKYAEYLVKAEVNTIIGVAGVLKRDGKIHYDIWQGKDKKRYELLSYGKIERAYTLDECMFAMKKSVWEKLKFDERVCDGWHFYCVDICYANELNGGENYVYPLEVCHDSIGNMESSAFKRALKKIIAKYRNKIKVLRSTCVRIRCNGVACNLFIFKLSVKSFIKKVLRKVGLYKGR